MSALVVLAVVALGLSAGAVLTEGAVLIPSWRSLRPEAFLAWYREHAALLTRFFGTLEVVAAGLVILVAVVGRGEPGCRLLAASAVLAVLVLAVFPLYFQRTNAGFAAGTIAPTRVGPELRRYALWHWGRVALALAAFALAAVAARR